MPDLIRELYEGRVYPPMSHPLADPAVTAVAARMAGLDVPHPRQARILEIGCSSGHHLIPLALRWPESHLTGIDLAAAAIHDARERAAAAGAANVEFLVADLREYQPLGGPFDFIIAHGFFSWVPDEVKAALLAFCRRHLSPTGIATISFNLESGWKDRFPVVAKVRAIQQALGGSEMSVLEVLKGVTPPDDPEAAVIDDMLAKGPEILQFDDFAPVNDAWPLDRFVRAAAAAGLRWLGESDPTENIPSGLDMRQLAEIQRRAPEPLVFQLALDEAAGRTFRSGLLCRDDATVATTASQLERVLDYSVRPGREPDTPAARQIFDAIRVRAPACLPVWELASDINPRLILDMIARGWLRPRIERTEFSRKPPDFPELDPFRLHCAHLGLPLVDVWHRPCSFPAGHYEVLARMDGSRHQSEIAAFAAEQCPELFFGPWLEHLAGRGFFR